MSRVSRLRSISSYAVSFEQLCNRLLWRFTNKPTTLMQMVLAERELYCEGFAFDTFQTSSSNNKIWQTAIHRKNIRSGILYTWEGNILLKDPCIVFNYMGVSIGLISLYLPYPRLHLWPVLRLISR